MSGNLIGSYRVRPTLAAYHDVSKHFPKTKDRMEVRRHALKLAFWPDSSPHTNGGQACDLDWEWVKGIAGKVNDVGELRIDDVIGGHRNLRIIFHHGGRTVCQPLPMIWILAVFPKKRNDFTVGDLTSFKLRRKTVRNEHYAGA
ncbi:hypothetical protein [Singulisphaera sp. GP187]|uniref:hypothetical protein n=1 Tax=Singulisphaera sp. GP187 TaxID=1882752 RepID=UPI0011610B87|nr:hypothetical protein [Singulisphaera sp. GP187]